MDELYPRAGLHANSPSLSVPPKVRRPETDSSVAGRPVPLNRPAPAAAPAPNLNGPGGHVVPYVAPAVAPTPIRNFTTQAPPIRHYQSSDSSGLIPSQVASAGSGLVDALSNKGLVGVASDVGKNIGSAASSIYNDSTKLANRALYGKQGSSPAPSVTAPPPPAAPNPGAGLVQPNARGEYVVDYGGGNYIATRDAQKAQSMQDKFKAAGTDIQHYGDNLQTIPAEAVSAVAPHNSTGFSSVTTGNGMIGRLSNDTGFLINSAVSRGDISATDASQLVNRREYDSALKSGDTKAALLAGQKLGMRPEELKTLTDQTQNEAVLGHYADRQAAQQEALKLRQQQVAATREASTLDALDRDVDPKHKSANIAQYRKIVSTLDPLIRIVGIDPDNMNPNDVSRLYEIAKGASGAAGSAADPAGPNFLHDTSPGAQDAAARDYAISQLLPLVPADKLPSVKRHLSQTYGWQDPEG